MKTVKLKMMTNAQEKISDLLQPLLECAEQKRNIDEWNDHATKLLEELDSLLSKQRASVVEKVEGLKKEDNLHPEMDEFGENCQCYECSSRDGFNQSLDQVLTLIKGDECKQ